MVVVFFYLISKYHRSTCTASIISHLFRN